MAQPQSCDNNKKELEFSPVIINGVDTGYCTNGMQTKAPSGGQITHYPIEAIIKACEMLENPANSFRAISEATQISKRTITKIAYGEKWRSVARNYCFRGRSEYKVNLACRKYTTTQIHALCQTILRLENQCTTRHELLLKATRENGVPPWVGSELIYRNNWKDVTSQYALQEKIKIAIIRGTMTVKDNGKTKKGRGKA